MLQYQCPMKYIPHRKTVYLFTQKLLAYVWNCVVQNQQLIKQNCILKIFVKPNRLFLSSLIETAVVKFFFSFKQPMYFGSKCTY